MSTRPYSIRRARLVPDLDDPNLYGAWGMVPQGGLLVDHTVQGNDGTPGAASGVEQTILGPMRRYLPNSGVVGTVMGAANAFALGDLTVSYWQRLDLGVLGNANQMNYYLSTNDQWGVQSRVNGTQIAINDDIDNAGAILYATTVPQGKLVHVIAVMDSLENLLYIDGVLVGSGTSASDNWASYAGTLSHGAARSTATSVTTGIVGPMLVFNAAKAQACVTAEYEKGARACQFKTDWGVRQSVGNEAVAGMRVGVNSSPFEIISGTWQMTMDTIEGRNVKVLENISAGTIILPTSLFEATPTEAAFGTWDLWFNKAEVSNMEIVFIASVGAARNDPTQNGYCLRPRSAESLAFQEVTNGALSTLWNSNDGYLSVATWYNARMLRRYDGQFTGYIRPENGAFALMSAAGAGTNPVTDLTTTTANYVVCGFAAGDKIAYADQRGGHCFAKYLGVLAP